MTNHCLLMDRQLATKSRNFSGIDQTCHAIGDLSIAGGRQSDRNANGDQRDGKVLRPIGHHAKCG